MQQHDVLEYLGELARLMLAVEVTDGQGSVLPLNEGSERATAMIGEVKLKSGKVLLVGNGGSAAIVSHAQTDLSDSAGVRALVFDEAPALTARSNDYGYGSVYEQPIQLWAEPGDLLLTVSSSGKSENIIRAIRAAKDLECQVITMSGFHPKNPSRLAGDLNFYVPSDVYGYVESAHTALSHYISSSVKAL